MYVNVLCGFEFGEYDMVFVWFYEVFKWSF